jgi:hypothetical protein
MLKTKKAISRFETPLMASETASGWPQAGPATMTREIIIMLTGIPLELERSDRPVRRWNIGLNSEFSLQVL